jgi:hypothetical protein
LHKLRKCRDLPRFAARFWVGPFGARADRAEGCNMNDEKSRKPLKVEFSEETIRCFKVRTSIRAGELGPEPSPPPIIHIRTILTEG